VRLVRGTSVGEKIRVELADVRPSAELESVVRAWLASDQDFNAWFLETTKGAIDDSSLMALLTGYGSDQDAVERAWERFSFDRDEVALTKVLAASTEQMSALKQK